MSNKIVNQKKLSFLNKARILKEICSNTPVSRSEIAKNTGLTSMTITNIVSKLIQEDIVVEKADAESKHEYGRKPILLDISEKSPCIIGINFTRTKLTAILCDYKARSFIRKQLSLPTFTNKKELQDILITICNQMIAETDRKILGIGVSCFGPVDTNNGIILDPINFFGLSDIGIAKPIEEACSLPVFTIHDSNAAAIAEKLHGTTQNIPNFMYVRVSSGIGCGFVLNNSLYTGTLGLTGELGHAYMNLSDKPDEDLESYVKIKALTKSINARHNFTPPLTWDDIISLYNSKQNLFSDEINKMCEYLSFSIINIINLLDIHTVILEYPGQSHGDKVERYIEELVNAKILSNSKRHISIKGSILKEDAAVIGAASAVINKVFTGEIPYL